MGTPDRVASQEFPSGLDHARASPTPEGHPSPVSPATPTPLGNPSHHSGTVPRVTWKRELEARPPSHAEAVSTGPGALGGWCRAQAVSRGSRGGSLSLGKCLGAGVVQVRCPGHQLAPASRCQAETLGPTHPRNGVGLGVWHWASGHPSTAGRRVQEGDSKTPPNPENPCPEGQGLAYPSSLLVCHAGPSLSAGGRDCPISAPKSPHATPSFLASPAPKRPALSPSCPQLSSPLSRVPPFSHH